MKFFLYLNRYFRESYNDIKWEIGECLSDIPLQDFVYLL